MVSNPQGAGGPQFLGATPGTGGFHSAISSFSLDHLSFLFGNHSAVATPLMLAVLVGAAQNGVSKASKWALFDPCKNMAYIPLDPEARTKGKAAGQLCAMRCQGLTPSNKRAGALL